MNVVIYARFSSQRQNETSIEAQLEECHRYCEQNNYNVVGEYIDRALSAKTDDRPDFQRMILDSNKKLFNAIIVYQLDRFARNRYDSNDPIGSEIADINVYNSAIFLLFVE